MCGGRENDNLGNSIRENKNVQIGKIKGEQLRPEKINRDQNKKGKRKREWKNEE